VSAGSALILIKVLGLVAAGVAFFWWQFRDLAREKERTASRKKSLPPPES
jgi:hypothetical protein